MTMTQWFPLLISCCGSCVAAAGVVSVLLYCGGMESLLDMSPEDKVPLSLIGAILFVISGVGLFLCGRYLAAWYKLYGSRTR